MSFNTAIWVWADQKHRPICEATLSGEKRGGTRRHVEVLETAPMISSRSILKERAFWAGADGSKMRCENEHPGLGTSPRGSGECLLRKSWASLFARNVGDSERRCRRHHVECTSRLNISSRLEPNLAPDALEALGHSQRRGSDAAHGCQLALLLSLSLFLSVPTT